MSAFSKQTIIVTGAAGGIGSAVAHRLAQDGATVCLLGRNAHRLKSVANNLPQGSAAVYPVDLTDDEALIEAARKIAANHTSLDAVVHGAAVIGLGQVANAPVAEFDRQFRTNVRAPYLLTQLLLEKLGSSRGQVLFLNSTAGLTAKSNLSQYAATKHALKALADSLRAECNPLGIRVSSIFLGATATRMQEAVRTFEGRHYEPHRLMQPEDVASMTAYLLAMPRTAEVTDVTVRPMAKA